jgi:phospholipase/lecithinase/hemolysin
MDAMPDVGEAFLIMGEIADSIEQKINILYDCGARNFLFAYIPPAEYGPIANEGLPPEEVPTFLSEAYNYELYLELFDENDDDPLPADINISTINLFEIFQEIMAIREFLGFTNVTDPCITPYVTKGAFCKERDEYFWWDQVHPTKKVHALLGEIALLYVPEPD